ncbi:MAG: DUF1385 domain-containing protein [Spirochaetes bacterium]|nr:DUF1385 domain-containing protein [Spirochaetota bacterium]
MGRPDDTAPPGKARIGGQAVIEGVMIRNRDKYSIAVRKEDGTIEVATRAVNSPASRHKILRSPFIRGVVSLIENLVLGIKSLLYSAEIAMPEEEVKEKKDNRSGILVAFGMIPALLLGVALFLVLPNIATHFIGVVEKDSPFLFNIIAGVLRLCVFLLYIGLISLMKDIRRTFQYHGAEHKSIFCYEDDKPLVVEEVKKYKTLHPRCGTSFLFFVLFITIIVFPLITVVVEVLYKDFMTLHILYRKLLMIGLHIVVALPLIASISYELLKLSDRHKDSILMRILIAPGLLLQRITTKEPDDSQLEVAIEAVKAVL